MDGAPREPPPTPLVWRQAAVLGSLWAASEILLGSFLHNLRVPLRGHVLTAIAIAILAGGSRLWRQRGVVWRAGLIAAAMKSVSPSAVLLGPMVAIAMEGFLFELGLALVRGGLGGAVLGGALAMSWTFAHQLGSLLITYGLNLVEVYTRLVALAERQLGPIPLGAWGPLTALAVLNLVVGAVAAALGWRAASQPAAAMAQTMGGTPQAFPAPRARTPITPHLGALGAVAVALPLGLLALARLPLPAGAAVLAALLGLGALRWGKALQRLARPRFWVGILLLTGVTAVAFQVGRAGPEAALEGLRVAAAMTLRAMLVTAGFAAVGVELANPRLRRWLARWGAGRLLAAGETAFATLPAIIAAMPPARTILRHPLRAVSAQVQRLDAWLLQLDKQTPPARAVIITGETGSGKTTLLAAVVEALRARGVRLGGVLAPGSWRDGRRWGFEVVEVGSGRREPLAAREGPPDWLPAGQFRVNPAGLEVGRAALRAAREGGAQVVIVDEVGPWELAGHGWAAELDTLVAQPPPLLLLVVRRASLAAVLARWPLVALAVYPAAGSDPAKVAGELAGLVETEATLGRGEHPGRQRPRGAVGAGGGQP